MRRQIKCVRMRLLLLFQLHASKGGYNCILTVMVTWIEAKYFVVMGVEEEFISTWSPCSLAVVVARRVRRWHGCERRQGEEGMSERSLLRDLVVVSR
jgi:hypothetical protein